MSARILVTGAAGFVGSFVARQLAVEGHSVVGVDNFNDYYPVQLKRDRVVHLLVPAGIECRTVELGDDAKVRALFADVRPEFVVHLAAQAGVRSSLANPHAYIQSNIVAFCHILEACRHHRVQHLLYASSSSVYGESANVPFRESDVTDAPVSLYAATKKSNELMAHAYSRLHALPATGLRFFTVYGPWGRPDMAYFSFAEKMLRGESIPVFAEGNLRRDFTYIDDIVAAVVKLLRKPVPAALDTVRHTLFNIGSDTPIRMIDFVHTMERVLDAKARITWLPMQPGDVTTTHAAIDKLHDWVGFAPATSLETGLSRFRDWFVPWRSRITLPDMGSEIPPYYYQNVLRPSSF
jgi:UDP-glucuronate 4-epimerase